MINFSDSIRSSVDILDYIYTTSNTPLRIAVDLRPYASPVDSQHTMGACVSSAIINAFELMVKFSTPEKYIDLSRLFLYYNGRIIEGTSNEDAGLTIRNGLKSAVTYGLCSEALWPYKSENLFVKPPDLCYVDAKKRTIKNYRKINSITNLVDAINNNKPIVLGIELFPSFMTYNGSYTIEPPTPIQPHTNDGHAICIVGYDMVKRFFIFKNSFGTDWGDQGYGYISFDYIDEYGFDMWCFDTVLLN